MKQLLLTALAAAVCVAAHPFVIEPVREAPPHPPPARLFVSAEGRYAIQQGWLAGADYDENKIATHAEAVTMLMHMTGLDPAQSLTRQDLLYYLSFVFPHLLEEGLPDTVFDNVFTPEDEITLAELARVAYQLRGFINSY